MSNEQLLDSIPTAELIEALVKREGVNYLCSNLVKGNSIPIHCMMVNDTFVGIGRGLQEYDTFTQDKQKEVTNNE